MIESVAKHFSFSNITFPTNLKCLYVNKECNVSHKRKKRKLLGFECATNNKPPRRMCDSQSVQK